MDNKELLERLSHDTQLLTTGPRELQQKYNRSNYDAMLMMYFVPIATGATPQTLKVEI